MPRDLTAVVADMDAVLEQMPDGDPLRAFVATYRRTTLAVGDRIAAKAFVDPDWVERWDVAFADLYLEPLREHLAGRPVPGPWGVAFEYARTDPGQPLLRHLLLGMNAHINYDLPQALLAVITDEEFDDAQVRAERGEDHRRVDDILSSRVAAEDAELDKAGGVRSLKDRLLQPANRAASKRFLRESRRKVWANSVVLSAARRKGPVAYSAELRSLESLSAAKVSELVRPGPVLLRLGLRGFGVLLPGATLVKVD
ncbi:MAG: DUF5995 family protein [Actinomycetes bacterium]